MRILMLGNSFTFANNMPAMLAELTGAEVVHHTRGGARLAEQLNPKTKIGAKTQAALENEFWDYVVLQEMSNGPVTSRNSFLKNVGRLCAWIKEEGAFPLLFATWAYQKDSQAMADMDMSYDEMAQGLHDAYREAADQNDVLIAEVGQKFYELADSSDLYAEDGQHPSEAGSRLAAETIAAVIKADQEETRTYRVDRILKTPDILRNDAQSAPEDFDVARYTREVFRMYDNEEPEEVTLLCANEVMKGVLDKFGMDITVKKADPEHFRTKVKVCTSPTFYSWVFQWGGKVRIEGPEDAVTEYKEMARKALEG